MYELNVSQYLVNTCQKHEVKSDENNETKKS